MKTLKSLTEELDNIFYKGELDYITQIIKINKTHLKFIYGLFLLNTYSFIWVIYNLINNKNIITYLLLFILLTISTYININTLKNLRKKNKENKNRYDYVMKIIDPSAYIKNQRKEKLKKLKKFNLFH